MSRYAKLLGIAAVMSGFGLSEALPAGDSAALRLCITRGPAPAMQIWD
jgi:hypothetical protein